jgi:hypothetical protein
MEVVSYLFTSSKSNLYSIPLYSASEIVHSSRMQKNFLCLLLQCPPKLPQNNLCSLSLSMLRVRISNSKLDVIHDIESHSIDVINIGISNVGSQFIFFPHCVRFKKQWGA